MIEFTIPGDVTAQGRPKFTTIGGHARAYDPKKSSDYKAYVRMIASIHAPKKPLEGPLSISIRFYRPIPKSFSKKKTLLAITDDIRPVTKPDLDNCVKGVKDAMKGIIWVDDSQVVTMIASKYYSENPRVDVTVDWQELEDK